VQLADQRAGMVGIVQAAGHLRRTASHVVSVIECYALAVGATGH
jgi:hypothetical protein